MKINSKWIIDIKPNTIEHLEQNIKDKFCDLEIDKDFFRNGTKNMNHKIKIDKLEFNKQIKKNLIFKIHC